MTEDKKILLVFDLVATLTNAGPRYAAAFSAICRQHGFPEPEENEILSMLGDKNLSQITEHFVGRLSRTNKKEFMADCNSHCDRMLLDPSWTEHLFSGVKDALQALYKQGYELGIFTGTRKEAMDAQLRYHNIGSLFNPRYLQAKNNEQDSHMENAVLKRKQLHAIVEAFKADSGNAGASILIIGDSEADLRAAKDMGLTFLGFSANPERQSFLHQLGAEAVFNNFAQLPEMVRHVVRPATAQQVRTKQAPCI